MNLLEQIISHTQALPEPLLVEIFDFICFLELRYSYDRRLIQDSFEELNLKKERGQAMAEILSEGVKQGLFQNFIEDPATWQREIRRERTLPGRE
jgi:hypothetical protein